MGRPLVPKRVQKNFAKTLQQVVKDLAQPFVIVQESPMFVDCPNCIWDSINKKSSNIFDASFTSPTTIFASTDQERTISPVSFTMGRCPVCIGEGQLFTDKEVCIQAMVTLKDLSRIEGGFMNLPAGKEGSNLVLIKTHACHYELLLNNHIFVIHEGVKCEKFRPPIVRGLGGEEAIAEMWLLTSEIGERTSAKFTDNTLGLSREDDPRRKIKGPTDIRILRGQLRGRNS